MDELVKDWERIAKLPASRAKTAVLNLAKKTDDPRLAAIYVKWLEQGNWPAPTAKVVWTRVFEHLAELRDTSQIEPLRALAKTLPVAFVGAAHRAWMTSSIEAVVKQLAAVKPANARIPAASAPAPKPVADPKRAADAVWKAPYDHELKQVVADALLEHEDPWGDFISIQLRGAKTTSKERTRAKLLEKKHGAEWLGAIGKLTLPGSWRFTNGFPVAIEVDRRAVPRREYDAALLAPQWATIETLCVSILTTPKWWITDWIASAASRNVRSFQIGGLKDNKPAMRIQRAPNGPWQLSRVTRGYQRSSIPIWRAFVEGLSAAERKRMTIAPSDVADREAHEAVLTATTA